AQLVEQLGWERTISQNTPDAVDRYLWQFQKGAEPAVSDLFNLRAVDENVNSSRGNKDFDVSDSRYLQPASPEAPGTSTDFDSWEPPDSDKGDIARALFYMDVRYEGDTSGEPDLVLTDNVGLITSTNHYMGSWRRFSGGIGRTRSMPGNSFATSGSSRSTS